MGIEESDLRAKELPDNLLLHGQNYRLVQGRRNGTGIFRSADGQTFARWGPRAVIDQELAIHQKVASFGFQVATIIAADQESETGYYIESSLGEHCFSDIFHQAITEQSFSALLANLETFIAAQTRTSNERTDWQGVYLGAHLDYLEAELPQRKDDLARAWHKTQEILASYPSVLTHGDLTTHNIFPAGVIDFENQFYSPVGYDPVSTIVAPGWFPRTSDYEMQRRYTFNHDQIEKIITTVSQAGGYSLPDVFAPNAFLRGSWHTVRMHAFPKLQQWRYNKFNRLLDAYLEDKLTLEHWQKMDIG